MLEDILGVKKSRPADLAKISEELANELLTGNDGFEIEEIERVVSERGPRGSMGLRGIQGDKGDKGEKGDKGDKGERGPRGLIGPPGMKGDKGDKGEKGERGQKGEKGDKGDSGRDGADGKNGRDGKDGKDGRDGKDGEDGTTTHVNDYFEVQSYGQTVATEFGALSFSGFKAVINNDGQIDVQADDWVTFLQGDLRYLKLNGSNDPMQGDLSMGDYDITDVSQLTLNTSYTPTGSETTGSMYWDSDNRTVSIAIENGVVGQVFKEAFIDGQNDTGSTISNGTPVAYSGSIGNSGNFRIKLAQASASEAAFYNVGLVTEDIANNSVGKITVRGKVRGIQTNGANYGETWNDGDIIYISGATAGYLTNVAPSAPIPAIPVALVISAHATNGTLEVRPTFPEKLTGLSDVNGTPLTTSGQILVWDNANNYFDFTQNINDYFYKPGISGGQTAYGGADAGDDLILDSTSNATKGSIFLGETLEIEPNDGTTVGRFLWSRSSMYEQTSGGPERFFFKVIGDRMEVITENGAAFLLSINGANSLEPSGTYSPDGFRAGGYQSATQDAGGALFSGDVGIGNSFSTKSAEGLLHVRGATSGFGYIFESTINSTNTQRSTGVFRATSNTGTPADGFGPSILFQTESSGGTQSFIGRYSVVRDSASNRCQHKWFTGTSSEIMTLRASGNLGIGRDDPNSILHVEGTTALRRIATGAGLTMSDATPATFYRGTSSGGDRTISLPASSVEDRIYSVKNGDQTPNANTLTFNGNGNTIDGDSSIIMPANHSMIVQGDGSNWEVVASHQPHNKVRITSTSSPYTLPIGVDEVFADTDGGAITLNLYAGANNRRPIRIINCGSSGNAVTVAPDGLEDLKGSNSSSDLSDGDVAILSYQTTEGWW